VRLGLAADRFEARASFPLAVSRDEGELGKRAEEKERKKRRS
jgi:hypothetical protein